MVPLDSVEVNQPQKLDIFIYLTIVRDMCKIAQIRQFNRTLTHHIGVLENDFLGRGRSIGASRILFEIGAQGADIRDLRTRLGLDSGYTSRLLKTLEKEDLIEIGQSDSDARVRSVTLTDKGLNELAILNSLSDKAAVAMLEPLNDEQRTNLIKSMNTVEELLRVSATIIEVQDPAGRMAQECLTHYYRELAERFDKGFNPEESISVMPEELIPPKGYFLVAKLYGNAVGCGALKCYADYGEVKRLWVAASTRRLGVGKRILTRLEEIARQQALPVLRLDTNKTLIEAQALYQSFGYREVEAFNSEPYAHHWFEKAL